MISLDTKIVCMVPGGTMSVSVAELFALLPAAEHAKLNGLEGGNPSHTEYYHLSKLRHGEVSRKADARFSGLMTPESFRDIQSLKDRVERLEALLGSGAK